MLIDLLESSKAIGLCPMGIKAINFFICLYFSFYEQLKFRAQLSCAPNYFYNLRAWPSYAIFVCVSSAFYPYLSRKVSNLYFLTI